MRTHVPSLRRSVPGAVEVLLAVLLAMLLPVPGQGATVTVRAGDTLSAIAARHGVGVPALAAANGIRDPDLVVAGTVLRMPGTASGAGGGAPVAGTGAGHTVRAGETLSAIAARYGVSASSLAAANGVRDPNLIVAGMTLRLPGGTPAAAPATAPAATGGATHTVRTGETLSQIAARYGVGADAIASANGIRDRNVIVAGRALRIPGAAGAPAAGRSYVGPRTVPRSQIVAMIGAAAARYGVDPALARAIAYQESGFNHNVRSHVGAIGAMQLMPYTAAWVGPSLVGRVLNPYNLQDNVDGGVAYLAWLTRRTPSARHAAAGYYQGLNALRTRGMFDDTKRYVTAVMAHYGRV